MIDLAARLYCLPVRLPPAYGRDRLLAYPNTDTSGREAAAQRRLYTGIIIGKELPFFPSLPLLTPVRPKELWHFLHSPLSPALARRCRAASSIV